MKFFSRFLLLVFVLFASCKKDGKDATAMVKGTNRIIVSVYHHTVALPGIQVYLKYNVTEFPGTDLSVYDWNTTSDNSGVAVFENLFEGNYFLYAKGFDQNIGMNVIGASPVVLNSSTISNNEVYITLYVTE